jgi:predicted GH43/DUF377 family glycosyl hydrolase
MFIVKRSEKNPILSPQSGNAFESFAVFNANPIKIGNKINLLYRAQSQPERFENHQFSLSVIGRAESSDGFNFKKRQEFISPTESWEKYGLEDPRATFIDGKYFIFYTALSIFPFSTDGIKVGLAISPDLKTISEKHLVTPFNAKAMILFPEKINGKFVALLSVNTDRPPSKIAFAEFDTIEQMWDGDFWKKWYTRVDEHILDIQKTDSEQVEVGSVPIKTKDGWLLVYSHIKNYFSNDKIFGIRAVLLDLKNPQKIIGKTRGPIMIPEESYEKYGQSPNIIFPSGAIVIGDDLLIYYGAADTSCAVARINLSALIISMKWPRVEIGFKRLTEGPLLVSRLGIEWESKAIFNPASIIVGDNICILYRAMSNDNTSVIGYAESKNGTDISYISDEPIYIPRESFENKNVPGGNSGCEDPRLTQIGDTIYMYYTAYNGIAPPAVAETHISKKDFQDRKWNWSKPVLVTADGVDDKDGCLHPEKVSGKYFLFHRVNNLICGDFGTTPQFKERNNFKNIPILLPRPGMWDGFKVGISTPPIKTKKGWLLLYHGVSDDAIYRVGAALLDLKDPTKVISRVTDYIFSPMEPYEINGQVGNVVFPCGAVVKNGTIYMYYGAGDSVLDVASAKLDDVLKSLL